MDVAVAEEPQKKVFRARKTMKISDRQQLEFLHNSLSSSSTVNTNSTPHPSPPLVNGNHTGEEHPDSEKEGPSPTNNGQKTSHAPFPRSRSPSPLALSLSLSPSPPCHSSETKAQSPITSSPPPSPKDEEKEEQVKGAPTVSENGKRVEKTEKGELKKEGEATALLVNNKKNGHPKPDKPSSKGPYVGLTDSTRRTREKQTTKDKKLSKKPMATETPLVTDSLEDDKTASLPLNTSSPSSSHAPESDQEVKEGFLVLSEEDDNQAERDETKEKQVTEEEQKVEKMEVDTETSGTVQSSAAPPVSSSSPTLLTSGGDCDGVQVGLKRVLSKDTSTDAKLDVVERAGKRQKVDGEELEAQLELKISADAGRRLKLEKVVQQLVEEQLRVLQLTVFDRSLQELRERVEKLDCATKHQHTLNTLQAKIARLAKKFGAANQTKENVRKPEVSSTASTAPATSVSTSSATPVSRTSRTTAESRQAAQNQPVSPISSTACPTVSKSPSTTSPLASSATVPAPVISLITTSAASSSAPSASNSANVTSQNQPGAVMLKAAPASGIVPQSTPGSAPQAVPLQPLLIQVPLTVTNAQGGAVVANHSTGVELFPVTSLAAVSTTKTKTTTTFILQKSVPPTSVPPLTPIPSIAVARAVPPGGSGIVSTPASGVSVSSARTPTQSISVVGVTSSSSFASSGPAATGGQSTGSAASGPTMASKTDNEPSSSSAKAPIQASRTNSSGAVIDLTEDDDDVQVTGVQKGPIPSGPAVSSSSSSSSFSFPFSQRPVGAPPPLISANNVHTSPTGGLLRSSPQTGPHSVGSSQVAVLQRSLQARLGNASSTTAPSPVSSSNPQPCPLPPLPSPPPPPARPPPEALHTSAPQQPQLKLARVQSQNGIVLSWCVAETDRSCAAVDSYHLYAYHQDGAASAGGPAPVSHWKKIGEVKALPLPMACTLTQFVSGSTYYFAVRARDVYGRFGPFCEPQCTDVIGSSLSS